MTRGAAAGSRQQPRANPRSGFLTGFVRLSGAVHLCGVGRHLLGEFLPDGQRNGGDGRELFSPGRSVRLRQRLGHPANRRWGPLRNQRTFPCVGQRSDHLPVGAVVGGCDVAVNLQCGLVVDISQPVTLHRLVGGSSPQQRLHVERRKFERPDRKQAEL